jgi:hypothetical protein
MTFDNTLTSTFSRTATVGSARPRHACATTCEALSAIRSVSVSEPDPPSAQSLAPSKVPHPFLTASVSEPDLPSPPSSAFPGAPPHLLTASVSEPDPLRCQSGPVEMLASTDALALLSLLRLEVAG